jgi:chromosome segregation ATPase
LNGDISDLESDVDDLWDAIGNIDNRLDTFEEDIEDINDWRNNLNIPDYEEDISDINITLDSFEEDISDINDWRNNLSIPDYSNQISNLK